MGEEKIKHYEKEDLTVVWKPQKCIHSEECVKRLPKVYNPNERPWIQVENASAEELKDQINHCPSGALSFIDKTKSQEQQESMTKANILPNGPIIVEGKVVVSYKGEENTQTKVAFCRCGASTNKPFCDGSHDKISFKD